MVADWNKLKPNVLEIATPCGTGGYAFGGPKRECISDTFVVCLEGGNNCFGLGKHDDCEWPDAFKYPPASLRVYYKA
ncbi:unnamed protein product [Jaminaea pallidilutea]